MRESRAGNRGGVSDDINLFKHLSPVSLLIHLFSLWPCLLALTREWGRRQGKSKGEGVKRGKEGRW